MYRVTIFRIIINKLICVKTLKCILTEIPHVLISYIISIGPLMLRRAFSGFIQRRANWHEGSRRSDWLMYSRDRDCVVAMTTLYYG